MKTLTKGSLLILILLLALLSISAKNGCSWMDTDEDTITGSSAPLPSAVSALNATAISSSQIDLIWQDNSNNEDGVKIERKTGVEGTYSEIDSVGADITIYSDTGLVPNTTYYYRVRAYNENGDSMYSNEASATTQEEDEPPAPPDQVTSPDPTNGTTDIPITTSLSWGSASGATSYDVYFGTDNPPLYQTNTSDLTYDPGTLSYDTTCYWQIDSRNTSGATTGNTWNFQTGTEPSASYQPDVWIKEQGGSYVGDDIYESPPPLIQEVSLSSDPLAIATYYITLQNDGNTSDVITICSSDTGNADWVVYWEEEGEPGVDLTLEIGYSKGYMLWPGQSQTMILMVTPQATAVSGASYSVTSRVWRGTEQDSCKATTTVP